MNFQVVSDLHLERYPSVTISDFFDVNPEADGLIVAGDLGNPKLPTYESFLHQVSPIYKHVILINGNHEAYGNTLKGATQLIREIVNKYTNVHFLDDQVFEFDEQRIAVLGCTLWSAIPPKLNEMVRYMISDYRAIKGFTPAIGNELHNKHVYWLKQQLSIYKQRPGWRVLVVTHHLPSEQLIAEKFAGSLVNCAFASDLEDLFDSDLICAWISGHTHTAFDMEIKGVRNIVNPYAYEHEDRSGYNRSLVLKIPKIVSE